MVIIQGKVFAETLKFDVQHLNAGFILQQSIPQ